MPTFLIVGDPHVTTNDIEDCQNLLDLVIQKAGDLSPDYVVLLGDLYNTHSIVDTRCIHFWDQNLRALAKLAKVLVVLGNHDQCTPTIRHPHALLPHQDIPNVIIVDKFYQGDGFAALPYEVDPVEFIKVSKETYQEGTPFLFCHQTFYGSEFYAKDAAEPSAVPYKVIVSGHIHNPMKFGKVWYPGAPRWKTLADANQDRFIYFLNGKVTQFPTDTVCKRIYKYEDVEGTPLEIDLSPEKLSKADIRVDIRGSQKYISERMVELKAKYKARCRTFPISIKKQRVSEAEGIAVAFKRFAKSFVPPNGTDPELLMKLAEELL